MAAIAPLIGTILVPLDGSEQAERALPYATALAGTTGTLVLLSVVPPASDVRNVFGQVIASPPQVQQGYGQVAEQRLARAAARLSGPRAVRREVAIGDPVEQIVRVSRQANADLIVMTAHGGGAWGPAALEPVAAGVIDQTDAPVLVTTGQAIEQAAPMDLASGVVVPIDAATVAALPLIATVAQAFGAPVRLLEVQSAKDTPRADSNAPDTATPDTINSLVGGLQADGVTAFGEQLSGEPVPAVLAALQPDELVILSRHGTFAALVDRLLAGGQHVLLAVP